MNGIPENQTEVEKATGLRSRTVAFTPGRILKAAMLRAVAHDDRALLTLSFAAHADGPVVGLDFQQDGLDLLLTPGIVKWGNRLFASEKFVNLSDALRAWESVHGPLKSRSHPYQLVLRPADVTDPVMPEIETCVLRPAVLLSGEEREKSDLLLLRFHGGFGSELVLPKRLADCTRDENVDIVDTAYAVRGGKTFVPYIFQRIRYELRRKKQKDLLDAALFMQLAAEPVLPMAALRAYAESKGVTLDEEDWNDRETLLQSAILPALQATLRFGEGSNVSKVTSKEEATPVWEPPKSKML